MQKSLNNLNIMVTGASGFIGLALIRELKILGYSTLIGCTRNSVASEDLRNVTIFYCDQLIDYQDWTLPLRGVDVVIHLAARVHMIRDDAENPLEKYRKVNLVGTINLAKQAQKSGVKRFIYLSTVKVHGESTDLSAPFYAESPILPVDPYSISKAEAESELKKLGLAGKMEIVVIRPPLVYGPGVKGNFQSLLKMLYWNIPLPLALVTKNRRSYVGLSNLIDLIITCTFHPAAANNSFLVSDDSDLSTVDLIQRIAKVAGKPLFLLPLSSLLLRILGCLLGKRSSVQRLCGSLQVDITKTKELLEWSPSVSVDEELRKTVASFLQVQS